MVPSGRRGQRATPFEVRRAKDEGSEISVDGVSAIPAVLSSDPSRRI
jgi:hypothetical protein